MKLVRALWHPLTPVLLLVGVLPLFVPPGFGSRPAWILVLLVLGAPTATILSLRALRTLLARIPVPVEGPGTSRQERLAGRFLRWLIVLVCVLGPMAQFCASYYYSEVPDPRQRIALYQAVFLWFVPFFFAPLGMRLWRDLASARRHRAQGLEPLALERSTWTGDARLDELLGRKPKMTARLVWMVGFASALAFLSPGHAILAQLAKVNEAIVRGEIWRFATASLVHGDLVGLAVSAMAFFAVAPLVEVLLGPRWLVAIFLGGGIAATGASFAFIPADYMGSTGAVAALAGLLLFFAVRQRRRLPPATVRRIALHGVAAILILAFAGVLLPSADSAAHLGGFAFGVVAGLLVDPSPAVRSAMEKARQEALAAA